MWGNASRKRFRRPIDYSGFQTFATGSIRSLEFDHRPWLRRVEVPCPAPLDRPDWRARLETVAVSAYRVLGLRDYARFDLRMLDDEPQILDVNVNPDLTADGRSAFVLAAQAAGDDSTVWSARLSSWRPCGCHG